MGDISNNTLAILLVTAIVVSLGATVYTFNQIGRIDEAPTGRATGEGNVTLKVESAVSMKLLTSIVDFGTGFVNTSLTPCEKTANLSVTNSGYGDPENCWTSLSGSDPNEPTRQFQIENDGNVNLSVTITGPTTDSFFNGYIAASSNDYTHNVSWKLWDNESACTEDGATTWTPFDGTQDSLCGNLNYDPSTADNVYIDIQAIIPSDLGEGTYTNSSIIIQGLSGA